MIKYFFILIFFTSFISCEKRNESLQDIFSRLIYTEKILETNQNLQQKVKITEPKSTWQFIAKFQLKMSDNEFIIDCLFYKVADLENEGELKLVTEENGKDCKNDYLNESGISLKKVNNFSFSLNQKNLTLEMNSKKEKLLFVNIPNSSKTQKLFDSDIKNDLKILGKGVLKYKASELYQLTSLKKGEICHKVSNNCSEVTSYNCDRCEDKVYTQVISSNCREAYNKICGDFSCGGIGEIACIRGFEATTFKYDYCINDSPVGFCKEGLRVYCKDKILICDY